MLRTRQRAGVAAVLAAVSLFLTSCAHPTPPSPSHAPVRSGPLSQLIGDNGLYVSGESYAEGQSNVSVVDTVYDDLTLESAGSTAAFMLRAPGAEAALTDFTTHNPLWGRWFSAAARGTAAQPASARDTAGLDAFFHPEGFWADATQKAGDTTGEVASTWAVLQTLARAGRQPAPATARLVTAWLDQRAGHIPFPVVACQLAQSYRALGAPVPPSVGSYAEHWLAAHTESGLDAMQALADVYGAACAVSLAGTVTQDEQHALRRTLTPYLDADNATALQRYYLAQTWLASGGPRSGLGAVAAAARADLHGQGAARGHTVFTGGLVPTYFAVRLQEEAGYVDKARIPFLTRALAKTDPDGDPVDYLAGAAALCALQDCTAAPDTGVRRAMGHLPTTISARTVDGYLDITGILDTMGRSYPAVTLQKMDTSTPVGMHALVLATAAAPAGHGVTQTLSTEQIRRGIRHGAMPWNDPSTVNAAVTVLAARHALGPATSRIVRGILSPLGGCAGITQMYAAQATAQQSCDLGTSLGALRTLRLLPA